MTRIVRKQAHAIRQCPCSSLWSCAAGSAASLTIRCCLLLRHAAGSCHRQQLASKRLLSVLLRCLLQRAAEAVDAIARRGSPKLCWEGEVQRNVCARALGDCCDCWFCKGAGGHCLGAGTSACLALCALCFQCFSLILQANGLHVSLSACSSSHADDHLCKLYYDGDLED